MASMTFLKDTFPPLLSVTSTPISPGRGRPDCSGHIPKGKQPSAKPQVCLQPHQVDRIGDRSAIQKAHGTGRHIALSGEGREKSLQPSSVPRRSPSANSGERPLPTIVWNGKVAFRAIWEESTRPLGKRTLEA